MQELNRELDKTSNFKLFIFFIIANEMKFLNRRSKKFNTNSIIAA